MRSAHVAWLRLALSIILIVLIVVPWRDFQDHAHWMNVRWWPFISPPRRPLDIANNVLLYIPLGYCARALTGGRPAWRVVCLAGLMSILTEWTQLYSHSRFPSMTDLTCNVLGAWAGAAVGLRSHVSSLRS